jgi:porphyrinogen peroxidase
MTMAIPQPGIFALGTQAHAYLEYDLSLWAEPRDLVVAAAGVCEPRATVGGVNLVCGFRPELWGASCPAKAARDVASFSQPIVGDDGYTIPAAQHDLVLWAAGGTYDLVFDLATSVTSALREVAVLAEETTGWSYHHDLDLTGFMDGTENPPLSEAPSMILVPDGAPGKGGSVLLLQRWEHDSDSWAKLPPAEQERVIGRTKTTSIELTPRPGTSHAARTNQDKFGHILRRTTVYGSLRHHGTVFVGFSAAQRPLQAMLESMAGVRGPRDDLTRYARPLSSAYYFVPSLDDLTECAATGI